MTDQQFLWWLHERLTTVHGESEFRDYMWRLRGIIKALPPQQETKDSINTANDSDELRKQMKESK